MQVSSDVAFPNQKPDIFEGKSSKQASMIDVHE